MNYIKHIFDFFLNEGRTSLYTKEQIIELAKNYKTLKEFRLANKAAYQYAWKNNLIKELNFDKTKRESKYSKEEVIELAKKYTTLKEFRELHPDIYQYAYKNGFLKDLELAKSPSRQSKYSKEEVIELAKKYTTLKEFREAHKDAYQYAYKNGFLKDLELAKSPSRESKFTKESVIELSKNYNTIKEFRKMHEDAYQYAWKNGFLKELELKREKVSYSDDELIKSAEKYDSRLEFRTNEPNKYQIAYIRGLLYTLYGPANGKNIWNSDRIELIANNFNNLSSFKKKSPIAYRKVIELGLDTLLTDIFGVSKPRGRAKKLWSYDELKEEGLKYDNKTDFRKGSPSAVNAAEEMGVYQEITSHMKKTAEDKEKKYTVFKTTFPDGETHYARFVNMSETNDYLGYCISQAKNTDNSGAFLSKIRETNTEDIKTEVVKSKLDEDQSYELMLNLIKNDTDSINKISRLKSKISEYTTASYIYIPKGEFIKLKDGTYWIKSTFYKQNEKEYKNRVDITKSIKNPKNGLQYFRIKASYRVLIPGETPEDAKSELVKQKETSPKYTDPNPNEEGEDITHLPYEEILKRVKASRKIDEKIVFKFSDFFHKFD